MFIARRDVEAKGLDYGALSSPIGAALCAETEEGEGEGGGGGEEGARYTVLTATDSQLTDFPKSGGGGKSGDMPSLQGRRAELRCNKQPPLVFSFDGFRSNLLETVLRAEGKSCRKSWLHRTAWRASKHNSVLQWNSFQLIIYQKINFIYQKRIIPHHLFNNEQPNGPGFTK